MSAPARRFELDELDALAVESDSPVKVHTWAGAVHLAPSQIRGIVWLWLGTYWAPGLVWGDEPREWLIIPTTEAGRVNAILRKRGIPTAPVPEGVKA